jgi:subtilisin-like proprotein convertase family protein
LSYSSSDVPKNLGGALSGTLSSTLNVLFGGTIVDVDLTTTGTTTDFRDNRFTLSSPAGTSVILIPHNTCPGSSFDDWSFTLDDEAAAGSSVCDMTGPPVGNGGTYRPQTGSLTSFDAQNSTGTWTLSVNDNDGGSAQPTLTSWGIEICVQQ